MATVSYEMKFLNDEIQKCAIVVLEAIAPSYTTDQLDLLAAEFNKEVDYLVSVDHVDRNKLDTGSNTGAFKSNNGLSNAYHYLMSINTSGDYPYPLFHSFTSQHMMMFNDAFIGKDVGKTGIFLTWLAEKHQWDLLRIAYCAEEAVVQTAQSTANKAYISPNDCGTFIGAVYEKGMRGIAQIALIDSVPLIQLTLGDYIKGDMTLQKILVGAGGVKAGSHLIPDYIINQRLNGKMDSKTFKDIALQLNAHLSANSIVVPNFDNLCKLMGIEE